MTKKPALRKLFNTLHLWLGLGAGIILFIVGLTGTVYVFHTEVERAMNPQLYHVTSQGSATLNADVLIAGVEKKLGGKVVSLQMPGDEGATYIASIKPGKLKGEKVKEETGDNKKAKAKPEDKKAAEPKNKNYFINPYTGEVIAEVGAAKTAQFFSTVQKLHRWLLLDNETGKLIVGSAVVLFFFIIVSGWVIWFPKKIKNWKQGFTVKFSANWKRINHDLHNSLGFYASFLLMIMCLTGLCWTFDWYKNGASAVLGAKVYKVKGEKPMMSKPVSDSGMQAQTITAFIGKANEIFPYNGDMRVIIPAEPNAVITVTKNKTGAFAIAATDKVQLDRFTLQPLKTERFADKRLNEKVADSIRAIHTGEIFGVISKILYLLAALIGTSLPVTGTLIWLNKKKKKSKKTTGIKVAKQAAIPQVELA
jgi:uncharacterized iron-regulated membrane protein